MLLKNTRRCLVFTAFCLALGGSIGFWTYSTLQEKGCISLHSALPSFSLPLNESGTFRFVALGDTGEIGIPLEEVAQSLQKVCHQKGCDAVLLLGDNFYPDGVPSPQDPEWTKNFETHLAPLQKPFFAVLGNHDIQQSGLAQVLYSLESPVWRMPDFAYQLKVGPHQLFGINTNCHVTGWMKIQSHLKKKVDGWNLVFGHHSLYSTGTHGDADPLLRWFWQRFLAKKVDVYLSGHNHYLAHLQQTGSSTDYVVSGAGSKNYQSLQEQEKLQSSQANELFSSFDNGFVWGEVGPSQITFEFFNQQAQRLYEFHKVR